MLESIYKILLLPLFSNKVLMGIQVPSADETAFKQFLAGLDMVYTEELDNPAYQLFLR